MSGAFHLSIPFVPSPNRHPRTRDSWFGTVVHFTASGAGTRGDVGWLCNPLAKASAHFVIGRDGKKTQLVSLDDCAWHAGISQLTDIDGTVMLGCNGFMLGIELDNLGPLVQDAAGAWGYENGSTIEPYDGLSPVAARLQFAGGHALEASWEPFPDVQIASLAELLGWLADAGMRDAVHNIVGHEEIALPPGRKIDPGPLFPWARFARRLPRLTSSSLLMPAPAPVLPGNGDFSLT